MKSLCIAAAVVLLLLPARPGRAADRDAAVAIDLLSYNVRGLSPLLSRDQPARRNRAIGERLGRYDVVTLQEDFEYPDLIADGVDSSAYWRGSGRRFRLGYLTALPLFVVAAPAFAFPRFSPPYGSGLTTLTTIPDVESAVISREAYAECNGWLGARADCWGAKGFLSVRFELDNGAVFDVYNTHLDAGSGRDDRHSRDRQFAELTRAIEEHSAGRAVIVAGDLNAPLHREADRARLGAFLELLALADAGAQPREPGRKTSGDFILFRSGAGAALHALEAGRDVRFADARGDLSDHPAIFARFAVRPEAAVETHARR